MNDRIKLAEAMGWTPLDGKLDGWWMPPGAKLDDHPFIINRVSENDLPDPETDANDDYEVLEWMRQRKEDLANPDWSGKFGIFAKSLKHASWYEIGDYAKAAALVLDRREQK